jgi:hypothetical protein
VPPPAISPILGGYVLCLSSTTLSLILISVSYSTTYRSLEDRLFQPILDCLVIRLVLLLPAPSPKTTSPAPAFAHVHTQQQPPPPVDLPVSSSASSDGCHPVIENCTTLLTRGAVVYFGMFHCLPMSTTTSTLAEFMNAPYTPFFLFKKA